MKILKTVCLLIIITTNTSISFAELFDPISVGTRASAMGGAYIGLTDDVTATYWNPAGLAGIDGLEVQLNGRFLKEQEKDRYGTDEFDDFDFSYFGVGSDFSALGHDFSVAMAVARQLEPGIGFIGDKFNTDIYTFSPSIAWCTSEVFSFGLGINIWRGERTGTWHINNPPPYEENYDVKMSDKYKGINLTIGGQLDFRKQDGSFPVKVGVVLKTPFVLSSEHESHPHGSPADTATYLDFEYEVPLMVGMGAVYQVKDNFLFSADYELRFWGNSESTSIGYGETTTRPMTGAEKNLHQFRLGTEYSKKFGESVLALRCGGAIIPTLNSDQDNTPSVSYLFSGGVGYRLKNVELDITWYQQQYTQKFSYSSHDYVFQFLQVGCGYNFNWN